MDAAKMEEEITEAIEEVMAHYGQIGLPIFVMTISHDDHFNYVTRLDRNLADMDMAQARLMATTLHNAAKSIEYSVASGQRITAVNDELIQLPSKEAKA